MLHVLDYYGFIYIILYYIILYYIILYYIILYYIILLLYYIILLFFKLTTNRSTKVIIIIGTLKLDYRVSLK
jgi:hypothetical protein